MQRHREARAAVPYELSEAYKLARRLLAGFQFTGHLLRALDGRPESGGLVTHRGRIGVIVRHLTPAASGPKAGDLVVVTAGPGQL